MYVSNSESLNLIANNLVICKQTGMVGIVHPHDEADTCILMERNLRYLFWIGDYYSCHELMKAVSLGGTFIEEAYLWMVLDGLVQAFEDRVKRKLPLMDTRPEFGCKLTWDKLYRHFPSENPDSFWMNLMQVVKINAYIEWVKREKKKFKQTSYLSRRESLKRSGWRKKPSTARTRYKAEFWQYIDEEL